MNENVKLQDQALKALISLNKQGVKSLLKKYGYKVSVVASNKNIVDTIILGMSENDAFTNDVLELLKQASGQYHNTSGEEWSGGSSDSSAIIAGALQGIGMITSTWKDTAKMKQESAIYTADKSLSPLAIIGIVVSGIVVLTIGAVVVIKTSK